MAAGRSRGAQKQSWVDKALHHLLMCPLAWHYFSWATCILPLEFCLCIEILPHVFLLLLSWLILPHTGAHIWLSNPKTKWMFTLLLSKKMKIKILYRLWLIVGEEWLKRTLLSDIVYFPIHTKSSFIPQFILNHMHFPIVFKHHLKVLFLIPQHSVAGI